MDSPTSATCDFAELNLTPLLPRFAQAYPELRYELLLTDTAVDPITAQLDVAIRTPQPIHHVLVDQYAHSFYGAST